MITIVFLFFLCLSPFSLSPSLSLFFSSHRSQVRENPRFTTQRLSTAFARVSTSRSIRTIAVFSPLQLNRTDKRPHTRTMPELTIDLLRGLWYKWRSSRALILFIVFVALFLDNMLLTTVGRCALATRSLSRSLPSADHSRLPLPSGEPAGDHRRHVQVPGEELLENGTVPPSELLHAASRPSAASAALVLQLDDGLGDEPNRNREQSAHDDPGKCRLDDIRAEMNFCVSVRRRIAGLE